MTISYIPADKDAWTENLAFTGGHWDPTVAIISEDYTIKVMGFKSIRAGSNTYNYYTAATLMLDTPFNCDRLNCLLRFALTLDQHHWGTVQIVLRDVAGNLAIRPLTIGVSPPSIPAWSNVEVPVGPYAEGWGSTNIDWSQINRIMIQCDQRPSEAGWWHVDSLHFSFDEVGNLLRVLAKDKDGVIVGKKASMQLLNPSGGSSPLFDLPYMNHIEPQGEWRIKIIVSDFLHWEDGSTNSERAFTWGSTDVNMIAFFESGGPKPDGGNWWIPVAVIGTISLLGIIIFYSQRKHK